MAFFNALRGMFTQKLVGMLGSPFAPPPEDNDGAFDYDLDFDFEE